jgi:RND family efflux transporter MFP subunit
MKSRLALSPIAAGMVALLVGCTHEPSPAAVLRPVRAVELRYQAERDTSRYVGTVQARHEAEQSFRVGGKIAERRVDVGQLVHEGDVIAVLDDVDYRLAEDAARQQLAAATARARQARSDQERLNGLKADGSVSASDEEHAASALLTANAAAEAEARKLGLARNQLKYTVLRASQNGVVTSVRFEIGQVVAAGQPVVAIADPSEPEVVVDIPESQVQQFKSATFRASLASAPEDVFEVQLRELSPEAAAQTRTYRARVRPTSPRELPLGATATLFVELPASGEPVAVVPVTALTMTDGQPALWSVRADGAEPAGVVELVPVKVHGYRNDAVLVSGPPAGDIVVTAGVQKMAPGLRVALPGVQLSRAER